MSTPATELDSYLQANPSPVEVEVGRFYQVPCIRHYYGGKNWIPVIGPVHDDNDVIGFPLRHLHRDTRFDPSILLTTNGSLTRLSNVMRVDDEWLKYSEVEFTVERRKCLRIADRWIPVRFTKPLEEQHRRCRIGADGLCPHRGIPVALGHRLPDGSMICAGHGLRWSANGELLPLEEVRS